MRMDLSMQIKVISNSADFFDRVYSICRPLFTDCDVQHLSQEAWSLADLSLIPAFTWLIQNGHEASESLNQNCGAESRAPFAITRLVQHDLAESTSEWEILSRDELLLRAQQLAAARSEKCAFREQILLQSEQVRIKEYQLETRCSLIPRIRNRLLQAIQDFAITTDAGQNHFCMALDEALANAFYHGNLELCSLLKEDGSSAFTQLAAERELLEPWKGRRIIVTEMAARFGLWITIQDDGRGFDVRAALERCEDPEALLASGRGLMLMQAFADEMFFNNTGNQVTLVLYSRNSPHNPVTVSLLNAPNDDCLSVS